MDTRWEDTNTQIDFNNSKIKTVLAEAQTHTVYTQAGRQAHRKVDRQAGWHSDRRSLRHKNKQTDGHKRKKQGHEQTF